MFQWRGGNWGGCEVWETLLSRVIFLTRFGSRHRFSYWNETGFKCTRPKFLLRKLFWSIWNQFYSDWIKMCHMPYETSLNETGFKWTRPIFWLNRLFWSIWNWFQMEYGIFIKSEWNWFQIDQTNIFVKKIILVYLKLVSYGLWDFYSVWIKMVSNRPK